MDPDLARLCAIPGDYDLTCAQASEVLQVSRQTMQRLVGSAKIETKRHEGRGCGKQLRVRIPRASLVRYLAKHYTGERAVILAAIKSQCPQYLPAVADLMPGTQAPLPANVIPIERGHRARPAKSKPDEWHPDQLPLFPATA